MTPQDGILMVHRKKGFDMRHCSTGSRYGRGLTKTGVAIATCLLLSTWCAGQTRRSKALQSTDEKNLHPIAEILGWIVARSSETITWEQQQTADHPRMIVQVEQSVKRTGDNPACRLEAHIRSQWNLPAETRKGWTEETYDIPLDQLDSEKMEVAEPERSSPGAPSTLTLKVFGGEPLISSRSRTDYNLEGSGSRKTSVSLYVVDANMAKRLANAFRDAIVQCGGRSVKDIY